MNLEYKVLFNRQNAPINIGILVMFIWSVLCCMGSAVNGPLGNSAGVLLFGHMVGNISRYWDPFIMGVFAGFVTYFWGKVPPVRKPHLWAEPIIMGSLVLYVLIRFFGTDVMTFFDSFSISGKFMTFVVLIVVAPYGMRGAIGSTILSSLAFLNLYGLIPVLILVALVYFGKWINWWIFNIIRHGFTGAKNALRSTRDMSVVQQS